MEIPKSKTHLWPIGQGDRWLFAELFMWLSAVLDGGLGSVETGTQDTLPEPDAVIVTSVSLAAAVAFVHVAFFKAVAYPLEAAVITIVVICLLLAGMKVILLLV